MEYNTTISILLNGKIILDLNKLFHIKVWRFLFILYSPLQLVIRRQKSFFPRLNFYCVNHNWQSPFYFRYLNPKIEEIVSKIENSN